VGSFVGDAEGEPAGFEGEAVVDAKIVWEDDGSVGCFDGDAVIPTATTVGFGEIFTLGAMLG
jgi:hypothetical protein